MILSRKTKTKMWSAWAKVKMTQKKFIDRIETTKLDRSLTQGRKTYKI